MMWLRCSESSERLVRLVPDSGPLDLATDDWGPDAHAFPAIGIPTPAPGAHQAETGRGGRTERHGQAQQHRGEHQRDRQERTTACFNAIARRCERDGFQVATASCVVIDNVEFAICGVATVSSDLRYWQLTSRSVVDFISV